MAEENQSGGGEKEFEATEHKRQEARRQGNVAQSKEFNTLALFLGILGGAFMFRAFAGAALFNDFSALLYHSDRFAADAFDAGGANLIGLVQDVILAMVPLLLGLAVSVLIALVVQRGVAFSVEKIKPKADNLNPVENIKKRYGAKGFTDFLKDTAKMLFAGLIATVFLIQFARDYYASSALQVGQFAGFTFRQTLNMIIAYCVFQAVLAAIDLPLQQQLHANRLKMTREEIKKESKQNEGDPQLKQSRRQKASQMSRGQMIKNVPDATVVMVNPEHYAVALKWDPDGDRAPVCIAKGVDHLAARIREVALANNIPIYRDPPAARSIYALVDIDEEIHPQHFAAVAAAIQFVDRVRKQMEAPHGQV